MNEITPLGDCGLVVRIAKDFEDAPEQTLAAVLHAAAKIERVQIPGVVEVAPAYTTVAAFVDPVQAVAAGAEPERVFDWLGQRIRKALSAGSPPRRLPAKAPIEIPVCYHPDFGFDLNEVARLTRRSVSEVADLHSGADYLVNCIGFTAGFPYLSGLPDELNVPRRAAPRKEIPAGSVAIGGKQTGIYPLASPGGWNVIGRTPLHIFDAAKNPPVLLQAGDRVRFRPISREEFEAAVQ